MSTTHAQIQYMCVLLKAHHAGCKILYTEHTTSYYHLEKLVITLSMRL